MTETRSKPAPPAVSPPHRLDVRRAFDVYVYGRNRNIDPDEKHAATARQDAPGLSASANVGSVRPLPIAGVSVPERGDLRYDRNAGKWRARAAADRGG